MQVFDNGNHDSNLRRQLDDWLGLTHNSDGSLLSSPVATALGGSLSAIGWFSVKDAAYGAKGDGKRVGDAVTTSGSAVLTSATAAFTAADVGKLIRVAGAGAAGATLLTTIASYQSATQVTMAAPASGTLSAREVFWASDDTTAILAAIAAAKAVGTTCHVPYGIYGLTAVLPIAQSGMTFVGDSSLTTQLVWFADTDGVRIDATTVADPILGSLNDCTTAGGFRLVGPGQGTSTGKGLFGNGHTDQLHLFDILTIYWSWGWYLNGASQAWMKSVISQRNNIGGEFAATASNCNDNKVMDCSTSLNTTSGLVFGAGFGNELHSGDHINEPLMLTFKNNAQWILDGGEFERVTGAGDHFIEVQGGARLTPRGANFIVGAGNTAVDGIQVSNSGYCDEPTNCKFDPLLTGRLIKKLTNPGSVVVPRVNRDLLRSNQAGFGGSNFDIGDCAASLAPTAGTIYGMLLGVSDTDYLTNIEIAVAVAAAGTVPTLTRFGICDFTNKIVAVTGDVSSLLTSTGRISLPLGSPWQSSWVGPMVVFMIQVGSWGTTQPAFARKGTAALVAILNRKSSSNYAEYSQYGTGLTDLPAVGATAPTYSGPATNASFWVGWS